MQGATNYYRLLQAQNGERSLTQRCGVEGGIQRQKVEEGFAEVVKNIKENRILKRNYLPVKQPGT